jgi:hypothetical protein
MCKEVPAISSCQLLAKSIAYKFAIVKQLEGCREATSYKLQYSRTSAIFFPTYPPILTIHPIRAKMAVFSEPLAATNRLHWIKSKKSEAHFDYRRTQILS